MRFFVPILCAMTLTACASTPEAPESPVPIDISSSSLKAGECGFFGWSPGAERKFIFFATEKTARFDGPNGPIDLVPQSQFPAIDYIDANGVPVALRLGEGELMSGGRRFPNARLVTTTDEGWERLQPVAIIQSCQPK